MFRSKADIQIFVFSVSHDFPNLWRYDELVHDVSTWDRVHFEYAFWTTTHKVTKLGQLIDTCSSGQ